MARVRKRWYTILKPCNIGVNKDGTFKKTYKKNDRALLTDKKAESYRKNNLIE